MWIAQYGYFAIFTLLLLGIVGLPIPDEWLLTFTGYLIFRDDLSLWPAFTAAVLGSMCGITISFGLGRSAGLFVMRHYGRVFRVTQKDLDRVHLWFDRFGKWLLVGGYFIPGVRHVTAVVAGTSKMEFPLFALFAYLGALIWSSIYIVIGYFFAEQWTFILHRIEKNLAFCGWILFAAVLILVFRWYWKRRQENGSLENIEQ